jgi:hypothetical protein
LDVIHGVHWRYNRILHTDPQLLAGRPPPTTVRVSERTLAIVEAPAIGCRESLSEKLSNRDLGAILERHRLVVL